jgi:smoothened protein
MEHLSLIIIFSLCTISSALEPTSDYQKRSVGNGIGFIAENDICHMPGTCQPLQASTSTCFGVKLSYTMTSPVLVNENFTQQQLQNDMSRWEGLRSSPKCWAVIQPLLCSYYFPKCQDGIIDLPPQELCKISKSKCRVIEQAMTQWPEFLHCNNLTKFPPNCKV